MGNKFKVRPSSIEGYGVFATSLIVKRELICRMKGEEISVPELKKRYEKGEERLSDPLQIEEAKYIDLGKPYVLINHSCNPNSAIINKNDLVAIRDIQPEEEISYDYSATEWTDNSFWEGYDEWFMECNCGSSLCRKKIAEFLLLSDNIKENYVRERRVTDYILEKFKRYTKK